MQPQQPPHEPPAPGSQQPLPTPTPYNQAPVQQPAQPNYDFIMSPGSPPKAKLFGGYSSMTKKIGLGIGILVVVVIVLIVGKSLLNGQAAINVPALVSVAQDQTEITHICATVSQASTSQSLGSSALNFIATAQLSVASEQAGLLGYLKQNNHTISTNLLNLMVSKATDTELSSASTTLTYNQTFTQVMKDEVITYEQDIQTAYKTTTGTHGRTILRTDYAGAQLLLRQLNSPDS
jgi:hypothetical protein